MKLHVGSSGYSYKEWKGPFYPKDLPESQMLRYYAERFPTVEINNTFYRMPSREVLERWAGETPDTFRFVLKAPQRLTHQKRLKDVGDSLPYFLDVSEALGAKRGPFLFQLPPNMKKDAPRLDAFLAELPSAARAAFEFRHASWFDEETFGILRARGAALCIAEAGAPEDGGDALPDRDRAHRVVGLPAAAPRGLHGRGRGRMGPAHPDPALGGGVRVLQARGRRHRAAPWPRGLAAAMAAAD